MLSIDTEGWDFDVLFGGSLMLDRTYYLKFEYHRRGAYPFFVLCHSAVSVTACSLLLLLKQETGQTTNCKMQLGCWMENVSRIN